MEGLITRVLTAIVFVLVVLGSIYGGPYSFTALFALITILALWEFLTLTNNGEKKVSRNILATLAGSFPYFIISYLHLTYSHELPVEGILLIPMACVLLLFIQLIYELFMGSKDPISHLFSTAFGIVYIGIPFMIFHFLAFWPFEDGYVPHRVLGLLLLVWSNDTGAYLVGSQIGKNKLFPRISPNKTWEGTVGGAVLTLIISYLCFLILGTFDLVDWMVLGILAIFFGGIGDLVESMLKRNLKIKDTGALLPGHGGILDRFDAFIFYIPFAAFYLIFVHFWS